VKIPLTPRQINIVLIISDNFYSQIVEILFFTEKSTRLVQIILVN